MGGKGLDESPAPRPCETEAHRRHSTAAAQDAQAGVMDRRQQDTLEQERYEYEAGLLRADPAYRNWLDSLEQEHTHDHRPGQSRNEQQQIHEEGGRTGGRR